MSEGKYSWNCWCYDDILYTVYGTALEQGFKKKILNDLIEEIHNSNMTKEYSEFKIKKEKSYKKPNLRPILERNCKI